MTVNTNGPARNTYEHGYESIHKNDDGSIKWGPNLDQFEKMAPFNMSDRELLIELVLGQREMRALVKQFLGSMDNNPMMKTMTRMFGGK